MFTQTADWIEKFESKSPRINLVVTVRASGNMTMLNQLLANSDRTASIRFDWGHIWWRRGRRRTQKAL